MVGYLTVQQIRSKILSFKNANFLISEPNPIVWSFIGLVSERQFQWGSHHRSGFGWEMRKLSWEHFCSLFLKCCPWLGHYFLTCFEPSPVYSNHCVPLHVLTYLNTANPNQSAIYKRFGSRQDAEWLGF